MMRLTRQRIFSLAAKWRAVHAQILTGIEKLLLRWTTWKVASASKGEETTVNPRFISLTRVSVVLLLAGCSAVTRIASTGPGPTVMAVGVQTNGVAINRSIDVMFSADMNPASINKNTFLLARESDGKGVSGTVTYDASSRAASFTPGSDLDPLTAYNATITTGAEDTAGDHLAANYNFSFATRDSSDSSPIAVYKTIPTNGQINVPTASKVQVVFTEGADPNSVTINTFVVKDPAGKVVDGAVTYDIYTNYATFTPKSALAPGTTYTVTINGVKDLAGIAMTKAYTFTFNTAGGGSTADLVYESNQTVGQINGWIFDPGAGTLMTASGSPAGADIGPDQLLVSPDRKFLYAIMAGQEPGVRGSNCFDFNAEVIAYSIDHASGALTQIQKLTLNGFCAGTGAAMDQTGQYLYVGETDQTGSTGFIDSLKLDTTTGMMTMVTGSPFASSSISFPQSMVVDGGFIYATENGSTTTPGLLIYQRDASSGSVTFKSANPIGAQDAVAVLPSGNVLYSLNANSGTITRFSVDATTGALTQEGTTSSGSRAFEIETDPTGHYLAIATDMGVYLFSVDTSGGLTPVTGSPFSGSSGSTRSVMFDTSGSYFATAAVSGSDSLNIYRLNSGTASAVTSASITDFPGRVTMLTK